jgi:cytochrome c peroxidase
MNRLLIGSFLVLVVVFTAAALPSRPAARNILNLPDTPYRYAGVALPAHFTEPGRKDDNTPPDNPLTDDGATLGRVLFYEKRLSANGTTSCASCHVQANAFADPKPFSRGFHGALTDRRAMPLINIRYYQRARFFWDERAGNLEEMVLLPIQSRIEMGQDLERVVDTLARDAAYPGLFARAFGDPEVTEQRIAKALAQFVRSLVSYQSRYDEGRARTQSARADFDSFTRQENRGKALFMRNCGTCHMKDGNEHFFVPAPANTGLRGSDVKADGGVGDVTLRAEDLGSFKSPSLRNVEVTAPYGHDGRFATLAALIDHYSDNPIFDPNVGYQVPVGPLKFTASEKAALMAFLKTLTDRTFLADPRYSNPFVEAEDVVNSATHALLTIGSTLLGVAVAAAQEPGPRPAIHIMESKSMAVAGLAAPASVIERLLSFDVDADARVSSGELPERMQGLVARGDKNADAALDRREVVALVKEASSGPRGVSVRTVSSDGLPGVLSDLKLPPASHAPALAIVQVLKLPRDVTAPAADGLLKDLKALLGDEDYENFLAAATRLSRSGNLLLRNPDHVIRRPLLRR